MNIITLEDLQKEKGLQTAQRISDYIESIPITALVLQNEDDLKGSQSNSDPL